MQHKLWERLERTVPFLVLYMLPGNNISLLLPDPSNTLNRAWYSFDRSFRFSHCCISISRTSSCPSGPLSCPSCEHTLCSWLACSSCTSAWCHRLMGTCSRHTTQHRPRLPEAQLAVTVPIENFMLEALDML